MSQPHSHDDETEPMTPFSSDRQVAASSLLPVPPSPRPPISPSPSPRPPVSHLPVTASSRLRVLASSVLDLLFPPRCVSCKRLGGWFCVRCRRAVEFVAPPLCVHCGRGIDSGTECFSCRSRRPALDGLRAAAYFSGPLRDAIHAFKYNGVRELAGPLGEILYEGYQRYTLSASLLVPVPLHKARHSQRGFNQSLLLAQQLAARGGLSVSRHELLRTRDTPSQVGLDAAGRRKNVLGAFTWQGTSLQGQSVMLIDDVCTTGATMEACAAALFSAGALNVWGLTLAREK